MQCIKVLKPALPKSTTLFKDFYSLLLQENNQCKSVKQQYAKSIKTYQDFILYITSLQRLPLPCTIFGISTDRNNDFIIIMIIYYIYVYKSSKNLLIF